MAQQVVENVEHYLSTVNIDKTMHAMVSRCLKEQPLEPNGLFVKMLLAESPNMSSPDVAVASSSTAEGDCRLCILHEDAETQQYILDTGLMYALRELMHKVLTDKPEDILEFIADAAKQMLRNPPEELR